VKPSAAESIGGISLQITACMHRDRADPRLIWLASVLAAATLVIFLTHAA
jgi:hypothetical protein